MRSRQDAAVREGEAVRRSMFGDEIVDTNYVRASDFQRPMQDWLAGAVWADVWTRDSVDRRTRSLITIGMLVALNRPSELRMHLGAALSNGCSIQDIQETLLQTAPYCGAPAALSSFRLAQEVLTGLGALDDADEPDERRR